MITRLALWLASKQQHLEKPKSIEKEFCIVREVHYQYTLPISFLYQCLGHRSSWMGTVIILGVTRVYTTAKDAAAQEMGKVITFN